MPTTVAVEGLLIIGVSQLTFIQQYGDFFEISVHAVSLLDLLTSIPFDHQLHCVVLKWP